MPAADGAFGLHSSTVGCHQLLDDDQPQPRTAAGACARWIGAVEAVKHKRQILRGNARTAVLNRDPQATLDGCIRVDTGSAPGHS